MNKLNKQIVDLPDNYSPSADEPFMNKQQREYFRRKLVAWRGELLEDSKETLQHLQEETIKLADVSDQATAESNRSLELRARDRQRKLINKIDGALRRIATGTYGYCEVSGEEISLKRLEARPIATLSIEAQELHERQERVYRDD